MAYIDLGTYMERSETARKLLAAVPSLGLTVEFVDKDIPTFECHGDSCDHYKVSKTVDEARAFIPASFLISALSYHQYEVEHPDEGLGKDSLLRETAAMFGVQMIDPVRAYNEFMQGSFYADLAAQGDTITGLEEHSAPLSFSFEQLRDAKNIKLLFDIAARPRALMPQIRYATAKARLAPSRSIEP